MSEVLIYNTKEDWKKVPSVHEAISVWENAQRLFGRKISMKQFGTR